MPTVMQSRGWVHEALKAGFSWGMFQHQREIESFLLFLEESIPVDNRLGTVIEIGSHRGGTTAMFSEIAARVISIDLPDGPWGGIGDTRAIERNDLLGRKYPNLICVVGDSHNPSTKELVKSSVGSGEADLLFIDGDHSYLGVREDYRMYRPFVRKGGVIAFHDINDTMFHRDRGVMVSQFWKQLEEQKYEFTINDQWGGIGAIRK